MPSTIAFPDNFPASGRRQRAAADNDTPTPVITDDHLAAGMEAFFNVMKAWKVSNDDARALLGAPSRATLFNWKRGAVKTLPHDTVTRLSYVLGIYKDLQVLYSDPAMADGWVNRRNALLGGQTALERMLAGDVTDLAAVRELLDQARGGW